MGTDEQRGLGPPKEVGPDNVRATPTTTPSEVDNPKSTTPSRQCTADTVAGLRRRQRASWRLERFDCGCADPWPYRCTEPPLTVRAVDSWRDAALHIIELGYTPLVPFEVLRALYRRGGDDRALAERLHAATGGELLR